MSFPLRTLALVASLGAVPLGCAPNPTIPECGGWRLAAANAASFGMYGIANCVGRGDAARLAADRHRDVQDCVAEGGDPAACRAAVYAPRDPAQVTVTAPARALSAPTSLGPRDVLARPVGAVPVLPVR